METKHSQLKSDLSRAVAQNRVGKEKASRRGRSFPTAAYHDFLERKKVNNIFRVVDIKV